MSRICLPWFVLLIWFTQSLCAQQPDPVMSDYAPLYHLDDTETPTIPFTERFWVVSSRGCPQELRLMHNCRLDVWEMGVPAAMETVNAVQAPVQARRCDLRELEFGQALVPGVPVCVFVHGSYIDRDKIRKYSCRTWQWLRQSQPEQPLQFIFYTWPSDPITYLPQADFNELDSRAAVNGFYLARILHQIPPECPVCLIGHSQGANTAISTVHLLAGGQIEGYQLPPGADRGQSVRVVLAAAAVESDCLNPGQRYDRALSRADAILNLVNRRDWALGFYHLRSLDSGRAVSRFGFSPSDYQKLGPLSLKIQQLDVTTALGRDHTWPSYYSKQSLARTIAAYVYPDAGTVRQSIQILTPPETGQTRFAGGGETSQRAVSK